MKDLGREPGSAATNPGENQWILTFVFTDGEADWRMDEARPMDIVWSMWSQLVAHGVQTVKVNRLVA